MAQELPCPAPISTVTLSNNNSVINFNTVTGKTYDVERTGDLGTRVWSAVATNIAGTGGAVQITDPGRESVEELLSG